MYGVHLRDSEEGGFCGCGLAIGVGLSRFNLTRSGGKGMLFL